jgi:hypothetical protein
MNLLPSCVQRLILLKYLDFADLQAAILATHYKLAEKYVFTAEYLEEKRGFTAGEISMLDAVNRGEKIKLSMSGDWKLKQYLILTENPAITKLQKYMDGIERKINFKIKEYGLLYFLTANKLERLLTDSEENIMEYFYPMHWSVAKIGIKIFAMRGFNRAVIYCAGRFNAWQSTLKICIISGNVDLCKYFIKKGAQFHHIYVKYTVSEKFPAVMKLWLETDYAEIKDCIA